MIKEIAWTAIIYSVTVLVLSFVPMFGSEFRPASIVLIGFGFALLVNEWVQQ